ncbi:hypothetical protein [Sphingobium sp. EP60837]|uniref:hypothetical protein n=1 Tax=Sphingobium sp. EP60837 TaxID=1855519 RepID=UPI0012E79660|nr:hypothetical protein [Sphingobium sp. EP60837]
MSLLFVDADLPGAELLGRQWLVAQGGEMIVYRHDIGRAWYGHLHRKWDGE